MFYILKATFGGPRLYQEHCYEEVIEVHDGIAVTEKLSSAQQLQNQAGFTLLTIVETADAVLAFLHPPENIGEDMPAIIAEAIVSTPPEMPPRRIIQGMSVPWFDASPPQYVSRRK